MGGGTLSVGATAPVDDSTAARARIVAEALASRGRPEDQSDHADRRSRTLPIGQRSASSLLAVEASRRNASAALIVTVRRLDGHRRRPGSPRIG